MTTLTVIVGQFASLPCFHLFSHRLKVAVFDRRRPKIQSKARTTSSIWRAPVQTRTQPMAKMTSDEQPGNWRCSGQTYFQPVEWLYAGRSVGASIMANRGRT